MQGNVLMIVPSVLGVPELDVWADMRVVVLDDLLMHGFAGTYFRRMLVQAFMNPEKRNEFERVRRDYLGHALRECGAPDGVLFIGTRASDVDLLDFAQVCTVKVSDKALRKMSRVVYGDPVMMCMEYAAVLAAVEDAVDDVSVVVDWGELPSLVTRKYAGRSAFDVLLHPTRQRALISQVLGDGEDIQVWMEDSLFKVGTERRSFFVADYDYLTFVRPVWRDAVVRLLGKAPTIAEVFKLPWSLVDTGALTTMCYRTNIHGVPAASARGHSLIAFVRSRLEGVLTAREMVGTWVGGLLCDDLTAVDTVNALADSGIAPTEDEPFVTFGRGTGSVCVPREYEWMYAAVPGVVVRDWDGPRHLDGRPRVGGADEQWAHTLVFADLYADCRIHSIMAVGVVQLMYRLHSLSLPTSFVATLLGHARAVLSDCLLKFDAVLTPMLPGYNYLAAFSSSARRAAAEKLGCAPGVAVALLYAAGMAGDDGLVSPEELAAELARGIIYSGESMSRFDRVGQGRLKLDVGESGYCYLCMFKRKYWRKARERFGAYPTMKQLIGGRAPLWYAPGALDDVHVTPGAMVYLDGRIVTVMHMQVGGSGPSLRDFMLRKSVRRVGLSEFGALRVGQAAVCYSQGWQIAAIIGWTIVGVVLLGVLLFTFYRRCVGGGRGGGGTKGFRY